MTPNSLRVCLVGPLPPPSGGMANQTVQLAGLLRGERVNVSLVQTNAPYQPAWVARVHSLRAVFRLLPYFWRLWRGMRGADVVHLMANSGWSWFLFAVPAFLVARLRRVPFVINYRGGEAENFLQRRAWGVRPIVRASAALIVPSGFLKQVFARFGMSALIVPNIINLDQFAPRNSPATDGPNLIVTRNLEPIYDVGTALRAFAIVRDAVPTARLTVAGEGPSLESMQALAVALGVADAVRFSGRVTNAEIASLYACSHICINPSLADNMPISVLEALASGVPVVSTDVGGIPYLVEHERTALLVAPGDHAAMAAAVLRLWSDRSLMSHLRTAGLEAVRRYDWASVKPQLFSVYESVVGRLISATARTV